MKILFSILCYLVMSYLSLAQNNNLVLIENKQNILPIIDLQKHEIITATVGNKKEIFYETLQLYTTIKVEKPFPNDSVFAINCIEAYKLRQKNDINSQKKSKKTKSTSKNIATNPKISKLILLAYQPNNQIYDSLFDKSYWNYMDSLAILEDTKIIFIHFGTVETLPNVENLASIKAILITNNANNTINNNDTNLESLAAQIIFGTTVPQGHLSQKFRKYPQNYALDIPQLSRLQYVMPENIGLTKEKLLSVDSIINEALQQKAMPGCQVLVAKNGKVFYHKAFGFHTYDSARKVILTDLYDLASVTKIAAGTLALMKLTEDKKIDLDKKLSDYLSEFKKSDKKDIILREMYAHQSGLPAGVATWQTVKDNFYSKTYSKKFPLQITDSLYTKPEVANIVLQNIKKVTMLPKIPGKQYLYSDLPFILTTFIVKNISKQNLSSFLSQNFYKSIGANLVFNPLFYYNFTQIIPTEYDSLFRKQQIHGTAHDEIAALLGGVSGHAGLFGSANDLAKLMQMYLQKGEYGGKNYLKSETLTDFTRSQYLWEGFGNYRGIGFNRPAITPTLTGHTAMSVSQQSFGHTGFTGTYTWVDTQNGLVYVFLSNRVYPSRKNQQLMNLNIRTRILEKIYELIGTSNSID